MPSSPGHFNASDATAAIATIARHLRNARWSAALTATRRVAERWPSLTLQAASLERALERHDTLRAVAALTGLAVASDATANSTPRNGVHRRGGRTAA